MTAAPEANELAAFATEDFDDGYSKALGPAYFSARRKAKEFMAAFEAEHFEPMVQKFTDQFYDAARSEFENYLLSNTEDNLQSHIWRVVDGTVDALLGGNAWALERYVLGDRYDARATRAEVAKLVPAELQDIRVAELEAKVAELTADLDRLRNRDRY